MCYLAIFKHYGRYRLWRAYRAGGWSFFGGGGCHSSFETVPPQVHIHLLDHIFKGKRCMYVLYTPCLRSTVVKQMAKSMDQLILKVTKIEMFSSVDQLR